MKMAPSHSLMDLSPPHLWCSRSTTRDRCVAVLPHGRRFQVANLRQQWGRKKPAGGSPGLSRSQVQVRQWRRTGIYALLLTTQGNSHSEGSSPPSRCAAFDDADRGRHSHLMHGGSVGSGNSIAWRVETAKHVEAQGRLGPGPIGLVASIGFLPVSSPARPQRPASPGNARCLAHRRLPKLPPRTP